MRLQELQEKRTTLAAEMRAINDTAAAESRDYTDAEDTRHKALKTEIAGLDRKIERARDVAEAERAAPAIVHHGNVGDGQYEDRARSFSLLKAINAAIGERVDVGFEREISQEVARRSGRKFQGIAVPDQYFHVEKRTLLAGSSAADLIPNTHRPDLFIDALRARIIVGQLGATVLDGLVGDVDIPKQTGSSTGQWVGEDGSLTETDAGFADVNLTPKTVGAVTSYSRRTLINALPSIENIVRNDLASVVANAIDYAGMMGDGSSNTPTGVRYQPNVNDLSLSTPTWAQVLAFPATIQSGNADIGSLGWATTPEAVAKLRATPKQSGQPYGFIMDDPNNLVGYPVATTSSLNDGGSPAQSTVLFGAWSQLLVGYWSGLDVLANPFEGTAYMKGRVLLRVMRDCDVQVRHPQAFAFAEDIPA
jgi:HK97 family phage major capsid protein